MIKIKRVNESTIEECTQIWNEAFSIYPVNIKMTPIEFQNRMINKELDTEKSVIAFDNNKPIGFILNSIKMIEGKICAWNGGTGVSPKYKGKGIGVLLMNAVEEIYKENRVEFATLEVLKENIPAMKLYEKFGYSFNNSLITYEIKNSLQNEETHNRQYSIEKGQSQDVKELSFYNKNVPWDAMYQNIMQGKSIIISRSARNSSRLCTIPISRKGKQSTNTYLIDLFGRPNNIVLITSIIRTRYF